MISDHRLATCLLIYSEEVDREADGPTGSFALLDRAAELRSLARDTAAVARLAAILRDT